MDTEKSNLPSTLMEAIRYFSDPMVCVSCVAAARWPNGPKCPRCESKRLSFLTTRLMWKCLDCKRQFSVKVGTIFEDSAVGLDKWLTAMWMLANCKNGISSYEVARGIKVTQRTAWFMLHRIRYAMRHGSLDKMTGEVEVDETFIGGKARNMHLSKRRKTITGTGPKDKAAVMGILERGGEVRAFPVETRRKKELQANVRGHVHAGSAIFTDKLLSYVGLEGEYGHAVVNHAVEYVRGRVHTNTLENLWSLLKRGLHGTYISVEPFHLFRYLDEQPFRYNARKTDDLIRFAKVLGSASGRRLTWNKLTCQEAG